MSRNNKKNQKKQQTLKPVKVQPVTDDVKAEIDLVTEDIESDPSMDTQGQTDLSTPGDKELIDKAKENMDLVPYFEKLKKMHHVLKASQTRAEEMQKKYDELLTKLAADQKQYEQDKKQLDAEKDSFKKNLEDEYKHKLKEVNNRESSVLERELNLDNNEHSKVIASLLESFRASEKKVFDDTESFVTEISEKHKHHLEELTKLEQEKEELEKQKLHLEKEKKSLSRQKTNLAIDEDLQRESIREELEMQYADKKNKLEQENSVLKGKTSHLTEEVNGLREALNAIYAAYGSNNPKEMVQILTTKQEEVVNLLEQLEARPLQSDYDLITEKLSTVQAKYNEIKAKYDDTERLRLKAQLDNSDSFQLELVAKDKALKATEYREKTLRKSMDSMLETIEIMKGEREKNSKAFEFAYNYDQDAKIQGTSFRAYTPNDLEHMCDYVQQVMANGDRAFYYTKQVIAAFLAGLHMSNITLLQGISGTGKTSLPREFTRALASSPDYKGLNAPYRICAVQSGWRDNMDLMGYYNAFEHKYNETDFFKALYLAGQSKYKDTLFLIILDEMNLSHPEHYFADFLSLLEQEDEQRYISIKAPQEVCPKSVVNGKLRVPKNVRFIGTANQDETTLDFAPKTYDRSNLIEMPKNHPILNISSPQEHYNISYSWLEQQFKDAEEMYQKECKNFYDFINDRSFRKLMSDMELGWGNRFEEQAARFIPVFLACKPDKEDSKNLAYAADHLVTTRLIRFLKSHYELQKDQLSEFENKYSELFCDHFGNSSLPEQAMTMLEEIMSKKA